VLGELKRRFARMYDAIVRVEGFKSWRPADPKKKHLPWWHTFKKSHRVHAFGLPKGTRVGGVRLSRGGALLVSPDVDVWFESRTR